MSFFPSVADQDRVAHLFGSFDIISAQVVAANAALAKIEAYNNGNGTTPVPLLVTDYTATVITGVSRV
jgi:hypothetical protein